MLSLKQSAKSISSLYLYDGSSRALPSTKISAAKSSAQAAQASKLQLVRPQAFLLPPMPTIPATCAFLLGPCPFNLFQSLPPILFQSLLPIVTKACCVN